VSDECLTRAERLNDAAGVLLDEAEARARRAQESNEAADYVAAVLLRNAAEILLRDAGLEVSAW
jgi:hypothetical protein